MVMLHPAALLTAEESKTADQATITSGTASETLMENAGKAVVDLITQTYKSCPVLIVCGTGNNGGDGFVVARLLKERKWQVTLASVGNADDIKGDAKIARNKWNMSGGATRTFSTDLLSGCGLVVDALFGTGLTRDIDGEARTVVESINRARLPVVAIDIASGVNATTGALTGVAIRAAHTVTFVRPKPGHLLLPGKAHTGELHVYDIGISGDQVTPTFYLNAPTLWQSKLPVPTPESNKYTRGHAIIVGGGMHSTGAARLAAMSALRAGSGLVSIGSSRDALPIYAMTMTAVMTKPVDSLNQLAALLEDDRITSVLVGPGCGVSETTREQTLLVLAHKKSCVIDADAITVFQSSAAPLFDAIKASAAHGGATVMTPHEGEFERIFSVEGTKTDRAKAAAKESGAVIILKGNDTVIASPDGRLSINANAPVWLATAGSGDVLAGIITGLLAQGVPAFEAACAGVWMQGEAANYCGAGLIAEDLPDAMPLVVKQLWA